MATRRGVMPAVALIGAAGESPILVMRGYQRSDLRHLYLHRVALDKLRKRPALRRPCLDLVERWLAGPEHAPSRPWLLQWREMLAGWPIEKMAETVLDPEGGQTLRQCSP